MVPLTAAVILQLAAACPAQGVPDARIVATAKVESSFSPLALHDNTAKRSYAVATTAEAVTTARALIAQGHSIDAGVMQVNSGNFARLGLTVETAFDAQANVCAGKQVLAEAYAAEARISCRYNAGRPDCRSRYPDKIAAAMDRAMMEVAEAPVPLAPVVATATVPNRPAAWDVYATTVTRPAMRLTAR